MMVNDDGDGEVMVIIVMMIPIHHFMISEPI